jgi:hypothetical protein
MCCPGPNHSDTETETDPETETGSRNRDGIRKQRRILKRPACCASDDGPISHPPRSLPRGGCGASACSRPRHCASPQMLARRRATHASFAAAEAVERFVLPGIGALPADTEHHRGGCIAGARHVLGSRRRGEHGTRALGHGASSGSAHPQWRTSRAGACERLRIDRSGGERRHESRAVVGYANPLEAPCSR